MLLYNVVLFFLWIIINSTIITPLTCAELHTHTITQLALNAARHGHYKTLKIALKYFKADPNMHDTHKTPLICIIADNYTHRSHNQNYGIFNEPLTNDFFKCLLKLCAQPRLDCNGHDTKGNSALHFLIVKMQDKNFICDRILFDAITVLIQRGCDLYKKNNDNLSAYDLIKLYAHHYHSYGKALLSFSNDIKKISPYYKKIACSAAYQGDYTTLKMCLKFHKISPNSCNKEHIPLLSQVIQNYKTTPDHALPSAESQNYNKCVMALINKKPKLNYPEKYQYCLLKKIRQKMTSKECHQDTFHMYTLLLQQNNSVDKKGAHSFALPKSTYEDMAYKAACLGHFDILGKCLKYYHVNPSLIVNGAPLICHVANNYTNATYTQHKDRGPFGCLYDSNYFYCFTKLCARPSKINLHATDDHDNTALHCLILRLHQLCTQQALLQNESFYPACHLLLDKKVSPEARNAYNHTAQDIVTTLLVHCYPNAQKLIQLLKTYSTSLTAAA